MSYVVGVDLGGTSLRAAVADTSTGSLVRAFRVPTPNRAGPMAVVERMAALVTETIVASGIPRAEVVGVGVGIPGLIDLERGVALLLPNIPGDWPSLPLRDVLSE